MAPFQETPSPLSRRHPCAFLAPCLSHHAQKHRKTTTKGGGPHPPILSLESLTWFSFFYYSVTGDFLAGFERQGSIFLKASKLGPASAKPAPAMRNLPFRLKKTDITSLVWILCDKRWRTTSLCHQRPFIAA